MNKLLLAAVLIFGSACPGFGSEGAGEITSVPTFDDEIKPIFDRLCNECHGADPQQGGELFPLRYDVCEDSKLKGKDTKGAKAISPRTLVRMIENGNMPPASYSASATPDDKAVVKAWIDAGSPCKPQNANNGSTASNNGTRAMSNNTTSGSAPSFGEVAEILRGGCTDDGSVCHQNNSGGLQITKNDSNATLAMMLQGNNIQGKPFVTPNDPAKSRIHVRMSNPGAPMPPAGLLNPTIIDTVEAWINDGAKY